MPTFTGGCHCGKIAFEVDGEIDQAMDCNCSLCRRRGGLLWFVPRAALTLNTPQDALGTYRFNKHVIEHHFCPACGISPFSEGSGPDGTAMACVNVRCLDDVDLATVKVVAYNGRDR